MRAIDADALNIHDISPVPGFSVMGVTQEDIDEAPTVYVDVAEPARWLYDEIEAYEIPPRKPTPILCSNCGYHPRPAKRTRFCPNCGALMSEVK